MTTIKQILKAGRTFEAAKKTPEQIRLRDAQHAERQARQAARAAAALTAQQVAGMDSVLDFI